MPFSSDFTEDMLWKILVGIFRSEDRCTFGNYGEEKLSEIKNFLFNIMEGKMLGREREMEFRIF